MGLTGRVWDTESIIGYTPRAPSKQPSRSVG